MTKKPTIETLTAGYTSASSLNTIFQSVLDSLDNTVSRDGSTPNTMEADFDLNSNDLLNGGVVNASSLYVGGVKVTDATYVPSWEGAWVTATAYVVNDLVRQDGNTYICLVAHTSGTFSTDLTANYWELFASKGSAGDGSGDLISTNNLSDVADAATSRSNLGLGTAAVENTVPVTKGGTGATTATNARTNLGLGSSSVADLIDEDDMASDSATSVPTQQSVKAYVDSTAGNGTWEQISRTVLSGQSSVDIEWTDGTYSDVRVQLLNVQPSGVDTDIYLRAKRSSWLTSAGDYKFITEGYVVGAATTEYDTNASAIPLNDLGYDPGEGTEEGLDCLVDVLAVSEAIETPIHFRSIVREDAASRLSTISGGGWVYGTTSQALTGIRIYPSTGTLASGIIIAYGLK